MEVQIQPVLAVQDQGGTAEAEDEHDEQRHHASAAAVVAVAAVTSPRLDHDLGGWQMAAGLWARLLGHGVRDGHRSSLSSAGGR